MSVGLSSHRVSFPRIFLLKNVWYTIMYLFMYEYISHGVHARYQIVIACFPQRECKQNRAYSVTHYVAAVHSVIICRCILKFAVILPHIIEISHSITQLLSRLLSTLLRPSFSSSWVMVPLFAMRSIHGRGTCPPSTSRTGERRPRPNLVPARQEV
jgi:hypothetical protein